MFAAENLRDWLGHNVIDCEGNKIGILEAVYVDTISDEPSFVTVKVGMISRHRLAFVPVVGATVSPNAVRVQYPKKVVHGAPAIDTDGELTATAEPEVFAYYNLDYGSRSERRLARR
ncbi:MAG: photosystem reaction center subunit H [Pseudonocardiales bacterium]|nr:PRC-barrel domain-containing protein [Pseudonocardiales bacterium]PZS27049.1 MAG: photosystem reaction center subunit H [Pseudonocardiales bacterium]